MKPSVNDSGAGKPLKRGSRNGKLTDNGDLFTIHKKDNSNFVKYGLFLRSPEPLWFIDPIGEDAAIEFDGQPLGS